MSEKPVIFISHSSKDTELARLIKQQIEICVNGAEAFASDIEPGENWFDKVMGKLKEAEAIVVLITPNSVSISHWVWFELGYFWSRHDNVLDDLNQIQKLFYPLFIDGTDLPNPVHDLKVQAANLNNKRDLLGFFRAICNQFNGNITHVNFDSIFKVVNELVFQPSKLQVADENYSSTYENFTDKEFEALIFDHIVRQRFSIKDQILSEILNNESMPVHVVRDQMEHRHGIDLKDNIFTGKLIVFEDLDKELRCPLGISKRLLKTVAETHFHLKTDSETENTIRFRLWFNLSIHKGK